MVHDEFGRECTKCGKYKPWDAFSKNSYKGATNGHAARCKECMKLESYKARDKRQAALGITDTGRVCVHCKVFKVWEDFPKHAATKNKMYPRNCKCCVKAKYDKALQGVKDKKHTDWELFQARALQARWRTRFRKVHPDMDVAEVPKTKEIEQWLHSLDFVCHFTGEHLTRDNVNYDHLTPVSRGGSFALANIAVVSPTTNRTKGEMTESEYKQLLVLIHQWDDEGKGLMNMLKRSTLVFTKYKRK